MIKITGKKKSKPALNPVLSLRPVMNINECQRVGILRKTHGFNGDLQLIQDSLFNGNIDKGELIFLLIEGILVPFFIQSVSKISPTSFIIHLDDIDDLNKATEYVDREVFKPSGEATGVQGTAFSLEKYIGYNVVDQNLHDAGHVIAIKDIPGNSLLVLNDERMIPFHKNLVIHIDHQSRVIKINIPEGL